MTLSILRDGGGIATGAPLGVDAASESARDKAFRAIEGHAVGIFERNPWNQIGGVEVSGAQGGIVVAITLDDPFDILDTEKLALLWDFEELASPVQTVREGTTVVVEIPASKVRGGTLTVWLTDAKVAADVIVKPIALAGAVRSKVAADKAAEERDSLANRATGTLGKLALGQGLLGTGLILVVGIGAYFYFTHKPGG